MSFRRLRLLSQANFIMPKFNSLKLYLFVLTLFLSISYFHIKKSNEAKEEVLISLKDYLLSSFISELPAINKNLPYKIDNETTLISISYEGEKILSVYELSKFENRNDFINKVEPILKRQSCEDETKKKLLAADINFLNRYQNPSGLVIFELFLSRSICSKI